MPAGRSIFGLGSIQVLSWPAWIGRKKFIYDLWGDAVNIASRMESHGFGGAIQITRDTYEQIKNEFLCEPRGVIHVKGKGEMDVWHVIGLRKVALAAPGK
jgi:guanylate cyclase